MVLSICLSVLIIVLLVVLFFKKQSETYQLRTGETSGIVLNPKMNPLFRPRIFSL